MGMNSFKSFFCMKGFSRFFLIAALYCPTAEVIFWHPAPPRLWAITIWGLLIAISTTMFAFPAFSLAFIFTWLLSPLIIGLLGYDEWLSSAG
jgi:hypothetical protein